MEEVEEVEEEDIDIMVEDGMVETSVMVMDMDIEDHQFSTIILNMFHGGHQHIGLQVNVKMVVQKLVIILGGVNTQAMAQMIVCLPTIVMVVVYNIEYTI